MTTRSRSLANVALVVAALAPACADGGGDTGTDGGTDGGTDAQIELTASPQYVNRLIPGRRPLALVTVDAPAGTTAQLTGTATPTAVGVQFVPATVGPGEVAEVWVDLPATDSETPITVVVTCTAESAQHTLTINATAVPGSDDLADDAARIMAAIIDRLQTTGEATAGLPADVGDLPAGTPVAGLLVVSHYAWFTDEVEIGLAWHIMVAPDDWAEVYVRPRGELVPTHAWRLGSWSTALAGGETTLEAIAPPAEVTR
jgi:hypothetical protein